MSKLVCSETNPVTTVSGKKLKKEANIPGPASVPSGIEAAGGVPSGIGAAGGMPIGSDDGPLLCSDGDIWLLGSYRDPVSGFIGLVLSAVVFCSAY